MKSPLSPERHWQTAPILRALGGLPAPEGSQEAPHLRQQGIAHGLPGAVAELRQLYERNHGYFVQACGEYAQAGGLTPQLLSSMGMLLEAAGKLQFSIFSAESSIRGSFNRVMSTLAETALGMSTATFNDKVAFVLNWEQMAERAARGPAREALEGPSVYYGNLGRLLFEDRLWTGRASSSAHLADFSLSEEAFGMRSQLPLLLAAPDAALKVATYRALAGVRDQHRGELVFPGIEMIGAQRGISGSVAELRDDNDALAQRYLELGQALASQFTFTPEVIASSLQVLRQAQALAATVARKEAALSSRLEALPDDRIFRAVLINDEAALLLYEQRLQAIASSGAAPRRSIPRIGTELSALLFAQ